ncbi:nicotinate-nicotinamide nucleotide adenylyltransferase [Stigmatella aurantiaca]|uniref:Probable nicotinate-nucleotide adenylyltransferase n=1 Tax=Stigmatella aurantiaca (strain DW4/3-1) TaxID=378806 RepID=E3FYW9_STIAD|nr:nicotinate-nicotinamide nucleotide adenylyltransferase [Stigmatella aurantiaca]ADO72432.1 nicotinate-nucleotide adenylyltransferase [Stigmatella aurantiaca DW4/3-1]
MKVALLGGSFNPPHVGHLLAALYVRSTQQVDEVWLMPAYQHPFGKALAPFEHRLRMCEVMCEETSGWLKTNSVERVLGEQGGSGRTVDTLSFLLECNPTIRFSLIIGSDILKDLPHWKSYDRIERMAQVLVLYRAGYPAPGTIGPPLAEVSSTQIRDMLARGEEPVELVPGGVLDYAREMGLYGLGQAGAAG